MTENAHRFIVIEGPIGVGKTSLARLLAQSLAGQLVLEQADQNPFLERFYRNPRAAAFQTQLFFLFQRARQLEEVRQQDLFGEVRIADYLLEKDRLFARVTLDDAEYALYERVYERVVVDAPKPDLVVYLQAPVDVLMDRISKRGIRYEQHIERSYLEKLTQAYARFFHSYDAAPLLIVNSAAIDPVNNDADYRLLLGGDQQEAARTAFLQSGLEPPARFLATRLSLGIPSGVLGERPAHVLAHQSRCVVLAGAKGPDHSGRARRHCRAPPRYCAAIARSRSGEWRCRGSFPGIPARSRRTRRRARRGRVHAAPENPSRPPAARICSTDRRAGSRRSRKFDCPWRAAARSGWRP